MEDWGDTGRPRSDSKVGFLFLGAFEKFYVCVFGFPDFGLFLVGWWEANRWWIEREIRSCLKKDENAWSWISAGVWR
jgi:hypothetical protein